MTSPASPVQPAGRGPLFWVAMILLLAGLGGIAFWYQHRDSNERFLTENAKKPGVIKTASGLEYQVLTPGGGAGPAGAKPTDADVALINYKGTLINGKVFDQSQQPTPFPVTQVVPGFSEGLKLMPRGSKYKFWIPPALGYGDKEPKKPDGTVAIPAKSILVFEVEMLDFISQQRLEMMRQMMLQQQQQAPGAGAQAAPPPPHP